MKQLTILLFLAVAGTGSLQAVISVNLSAGFGEYPIADSGGTPLPDGNEVRIGFFDGAFVTGGGLDDLGLADLATLDSNFTTFATTTITTLTAGSDTQPGSFSDSGSSSDSAFDNQSIYLWIFDTSDDLAPDGTFSNVEEYGLYGSTDPAWVFPTQTDTFPTTTINTTQIDEFFVGELDAGNDQLLTAVPEPAQVGLLFGIGTLTFAFVRRRRAL